MVGLDTFHHIQKIRILEFIAASKIREIAADGKSKNRSSSNFFLFCMPDVCLYIIQNMKRQGIAHAGGQWFYQILWRMPQKLKAVRRQEEYTTPDQPLMPPYSCFFFFKNCCNVEIVIQDKSSSIAHLTTMMKRFHLALGLASCFNLHSASEMKTPFA